MARFDVQYVLDKNGRPKSVIIPLKLWQDIQSERENRLLAEKPGHEEAAAESQTALDGHALRDCL